MRAYIPEELRARLRQADQAQCVYCQTREAISGIALTVDHILPRARGGATTFENLCLACRNCNEFKADQTQAIDPLLGDMVNLFNPRTQVWSEHFAWSADGVLIMGITGCGRATVIALRLNNPLIVSARGRWVSAGWHPPS